MTTTKTYKPTATARILLVLLRDNGPSTLGQLVDKTESSSQYLTTLLNGLVNNGYATLTNRIYAIAPATPSATPTI